jgi:hypothetical protein
MDCRGNSYRKKVQQKGSGGKRSPGQCHLRAISRAIHSPSRPSARATHLRTICRIIAVYRARFEKPLEGFWGLSRS